MKSLKIKMIHMKQGQNKIMAILLFYIFILNACNADKSKEVKPIRKDIDEIVFASGTIESDNKYNLMAQMDGTLTQFNIKEGNVVSSGQIVAYIDNKQNNINTQTAQEQLDIAKYNLSNNAPLLQQIQANIDAANDKLAQDELQLKRYENLYNENSATKAELEKYQLAVKTSKAGLNALKQQYKSVQQQSKQQYIQQSNAVKVSQTIQAYNQVKIVAPGKVYRKTKQVGDYVRRGDIIAVIANEGLLYAKLNVDENSIDKLRVGQIVTIQLNTQKNKKYQAAISEIMPQFDEQSQSFIVKVQFADKPDFTINGTQLEANVLIGEKKNALLIPRNYMTFGNKVQVKGNDKLVTITPGIVSTEYVEVLSGISENDILVPVKPQR